METFLEKYESARITVDSDFGLRFALGTFGIFASMLAITTLALTTAS